MDTSRNNLLNPLTSSPQRSAIGRRFESPCEGSLLFDCYPGGNRTYLVYAPQLTPADYPAMHSRILSWLPHFEQGGYLSAPAAPSSAIRLHMSGGEFCGNALRACGALIVQDFLWHRCLSSVANYGSIRADGDGFLFSVEISGTSAPLQIRVSNTGEGWFVTAEMPSVVATRDIVPGEVVVVGSKVRAVLVRLPGIAHVIFSEPLRLNADQENGEILTRAREVFELRDEPAIGLIGCSRRSEQCSIFPVVWVRETSSFIAETSCGSGSLAFGYAALSTSPETSASCYRVVQPSGATITVSVMRDPSTQSLNGSIAGDVDAVRMVAWEGVGPLLAIDPKSSSLEIG